MTDQTAGHENALRDFDRHFRSCNIMSIIFTSCNFMSYNLVRHFHVLHFHVRRFQRPGLFIALSNLLSLTGGSVNTQNDTSIIMAND